MVSTRNWRKFALGLAMVPAVMSSESRLFAAPGPVPFAAAGDEMPPGNDAEARNLIGKAREALKLGDLAKAELLAKQAQSLKVSFPFWEKDTPEAVLADVNSVRAKSAAMADPKATLKLAREALTANKFDEAQALASRAAGSNYRWGMLDDTPAKCLDDISKTRDKMNKGDSVKLLAEARKLYEQNKWDEAEAMAYRADRLHGPYSVMDVGDRPKKVLEDIAVARAKSKKTGIVPPPAVVKRDSADANRMAPAPTWDDDKGIASVAKGESSYGGIKQVAANSPTAKVQATKLMAEGRSAMSAGRMSEAHTKFKEAHRTCSDFRPDEDNPSRCLNELMTAVNRRVANCVNSGSEQKLAEGRQLAAEFKLDCKAIDAKLDEMKKMAPAIAGSTVAAGESLLEKARLEIRKGATQVARELATEAHNGPYGVQIEAAAVLRSIDAEEQTLKSGMAIRSFEAGLIAYQSMDYVQAMAILRQIDQEQLPSEHLAKVRDMLESCKQKADMLASVPAKEMAAPPIMPTAMASADAPPAKQTASQESLADQVRALQKVEFQRLREEGMKAQIDAKKLFERGETDASLEMLEDYLAKVKSSQLEAKEISMLQGPVETRLQSLKSLKSRQDFNTKIASKRSKHDADKGREVNAATQKQEQVTELFKQYNSLTTEGKLAEAQLVAAKLKQLDPENPSIIALQKVAHVKYDVAAYDEAKTNKEDMFVKGLNQAENPGPYVDSDKPVHIDPVTMKIANGRDKGVDQLNQLKTDAEREIQHKLTSVVDLSFTNIPLQQVIEDLRLMTGINIVAEVTALEDERISLETPITCKLDKIRLETGIKVLLSNLHLTHVIADDVLKITTEKKARGRIVSKVYRVADLVMPIEDYLQPQSMNLERSMQRVIDQQQMKLGNGQAPFNNGKFMLPDGQPVGNSGSMSSTNSNGQMTTQPGMSQIGAPTTQKQTMDAMLLKLIQSTVSPHTWSEVGGVGTIEYMPIGMALVINQTPDVQEQVQELLEALRRLQDLQIAIEVRLITLSETFFERIGLDFNLNVKTDRNTSHFEPQITTGNFKPPGQVNDFSPNRFVAGLTPAGSQNLSPGGFTSDLDVPIRTSSFQYGIPPFAYPNNPGFDGGLSMGLAFLSDIQVYMFMEAAQGDRRIHVMQAPKLTLFNGQSATISVLDQQFFVTNVGVVGFGGQIVFVPQNNPFPLGVEMTLQAVVSADRRFVRINTNIRLSNLASANVPLFPVTTFITPVFEGGAQGQPIPFTQFIQQPQLSLVNIQTTVAIPDGGTVILGGLKTLSEGRNEFGPPVLSKVPYVNRLFRNTGFGREAQSLLVMVTPRIIINAEEEEKQAGYKSNPEQ